MTLSKLLFFSVIASIVLATACSSSPDETCKAGTQCVCNGNCDKTCGGDGSNCEFVCQSGNCNFSCPAGGCQVSGPGNATLDCPKGGCKLACDGASCKLTSCTSNCTVACGTSTTSCQSSCSDPNAGCIGGNP